MKKISLTNKQKGKLEEMCRILFPEYEIICNHQDLKNKVFVNHSVGCGFLKYPHAINELWILHKKKDEFCVIHWFEFCMTHLANKVLKSHPTSEFSEFGKIADKFYIGQMWFMMYSHNLHIVDHLYEEFKKLK